MSNLIHQINQFLGESDEPEMLDGIETSTRYIACTCLSSQQVSEVIHGDRYVDWNFAQSEDEYDRVVGDGLVVVFLKDGYHSWMKDQFLEPGETAVEFDPGDPEYEEVEDEVSEEQIEYTLSMMAVVFDDCGEVTNYFVRFPVSISPTSCWKEEDVEHILGIQFSQLERCREEYLDQFEN